MWQSKETFSLLHYNFLKVPLRPAQQFWTRPCALSSPVTAADARRRQIPCEDVLEDGTHVRNRRSHARSLSQKCTPVPSQTFPRPAPTAPRLTCAGRHRRMSDMCSSRMGTPRMGTPNKPRLSSSSSTTTTSTPSFFPLQTDKNNVDLALGQTTGPHRRTRKKQKK